MTGAHIAAIHFHYHLKQWFSPDTLPARGLWAISRDIWLPHLDAVGTRVEARDVGKHPTMNRTALRTKNYLSQILVTPGLKGHY